MERNGLTWNSRLAGGRPPSLLRDLSGNGLTCPLALQRRHSPCAHASWSRRTDQKIRKKEQVAYLLCASGPALPQGSAAIALPLGMGQRGDVKPASRGLGLRSAPREAA